MTLQSSAVAAGACRAPGASRRCRGAGPWHRRLCQTLPEGSSCWGMDHPCAPCHPPGWGCRELPGAGGSCPFIPEGHSDEGLRHGQPRGLGTLPAI